MALSFRGNIVGSDVVIGWVSDAGEATLVVSEETSQKMYHFLTKKYFGRCLAFFNQSQFFQVMSSTFRDNQCFLQFSGILITKIKTTNKNVSFLGRPRRPRPPLRARQVSGLPVGGGIPVPGRDRAQVQEEAKHLRRGRPGRFGLFIKKILTIFNKTFVKCKVFLKNNNTETQLYY